MLIIFRGAPLFWDLVKSLINREFVVAICVNNSETKINVDLVLLLLSEVTLRNAVVEICLLSEDLVPQIDLRPPGCLNIMAGSELILKGNSTYDCEGA